MVEHKSGRPEESANPHKAQAADRLVKRGRRLKVADISETLDISIGTVHTILHDDFGWVLESELQVGVLERSSTIGRWTDAGPPPSDLKEERVPSRL